MVTDDKQLRFDFMDTTPKQLSPKAEYAAYLRATRDEAPATTGGSHVAKAQGRKVLSRQV